MSIPLPALKTNNYSKDFSIEAQTIDLVTDDWNGTGFDFDGVLGRASRAPVISGGAGQISVCMWIQTTEAGANTSMINQYEGNDGPGSDQKFFQFNMASGGLQAICYSDNPSNFTRSISSDTFNDDVLYFIAFSAETDGASTENIDIFYATLTTDLAEVSYTQDSANVGSGWNFCSSANDQTVLSVGDFQHTNLAWDGFQTRCRVWDGVTVTQAQFADLLAFEKEAMNLTLETVVAGGASYGKEPIRRINKSISLSKELQKEITRRDNTVRVYRPRTQSQIDGARTKSQREGGSIKRG